MVTIVDVFGIEAEMFHRKKRIDLGNTDLTISTKNSPVPPFWFEVFHRDSNRYALITGFALGAVYSFATSSESRLG